MIRYGSFYSVHSSKILTIQQGDSYYFNILSNPCTHHWNNQVDISAKLPELYLLDTTRISNGTNFPRLALLYRQNF